MFYFKLNELAELRILEQRYAEVIYASVDRNRVRLRQWLPWVDGNQGPEDVKIFLRRSLQQFADNDGFHAGLFVDGQFAGVVGYHHVNWLNRNTTIGYWLDQAFEGRGLMTAAVRALTDNAISNWKLNRVEIRAALENVRSRAVPERLGFKLEGTLCQAEWLYDHFVDHAVYATIAKDWPRQNHLA